VSLVESQCATLLLTKDTLSSLIQQNHGATVILEFGEITVCRCVISKNYTKEFISTKSRCYYDFIKFTVIPNMHSLFHNYKMRLPNAYNRFKMSLCQVNFDPRIYYYKEGKLDYLKISFKLENPKKKS
jgi:hypothetical protein